ncbi:tellurite resistance protein [Rahnella sp. BIGb0603]|uniref:dicarboxylate transporter/tellurite-resistance protein TehA n=1 Tax=Rahnella sp. BIGb0603 TaxID=2940612 RepID=UPI0021671DAE|nr:dicarboxylate transporter/tellurite-resistance protein TehA [Rahnella sp. BIGb0603]MCS3423160.1 tellurite resistance protein [Rahnella sp. BIGb0603]
MSFSQFVHRVPVSFFGMVLGVFGLGSAWRYAATLGLGPAWLGEMLIFAGSSIWLTLTVIYVGRCLAEPKAVREEFLNNNQFSFISLLPAGGVLVSTGLHPYNLLLANTLMTAGATGQLIFSAWRCAPLWRGEFASEATTPGFYLPTVAANFICAMAFGTAGHQDIGALFLGAGLISWLTLEPAIIHRLRTQKELSGPARGVIGVQLAPAFVACYAWLCVNGNHFDMFALLLLGYGLLQLFFMLRLVRWFFAGGFSPSMWAFSFGLSAMANASLRLAHSRQVIDMQILSWILFSLANLLLAGLIVKTLLLLMSGRLLPGK